MTSRLLHMPVVVPVIYLVGSSTRPGDYLLEGEPLSVVGHMLGAVQGKLFWADKPELLFATKTECAVTSWSAQEIAATMCNPAAIGNIGYLVVERADARASYGRPATVLSLLVEWTFAVGSRPATIATNIEGGIAYTTNGGDDVLQTQDVDGLDPFAEGSYARGVNTPWSPAKSAVFMQTSEMWDRLTASSATGVNLGALATETVGRMMVRLRDGSMSTPDVQFRVRNGAGSLLGGDWIETTHTGWHSIEQFWHNVGGAVTAKAWLDAVVLPFNSTNQWTGTGFGSATIDRVHVGVRYNDDASLAGTYVGPEDQAALTEVRSCKAWGM